MKPAHSQEAETPQAPFLAIDQLSKRFGALTVLAGIDLVVHKGEFVCLLGPSGCGKTTLLRQVAGLDRPDSGRIVMNGRDVTQLPPGQRDYGIVFQSYALFPNLTVADNIGYGLQGPRATRQQRIRSLLSLINLDAIADRYPAQLSGGQQQRVALARALATSPSLLLLDEPLSALDAQVRQHLRQEIKALQHTLNITTIMVTHDQEEALTMADRIVVMHQGRIEQIGTPAEIYHQPATRFVASFVGQGNWLHARPVGNDQLQLGELTLPRPAVLPPINAQGQIELFCRPEHIVLHPNWPAAGVATALADIQRIELLGPIYRLHLHVPAWGQQTVLADIGHQTFFTQAIARQQRVTISLPDASQLLFESEPRP
ncbi:putative 2-aminoethylphosphonate ABC transporter ATP-binding protein [Chitinivorax tropicus]|nr:putative 2-aminoethylphosphonate ABC transporter ATP-binding protein [Chitinivorax tropicus]